MHIRSSYYGADEFFEVQGTDGWIWVTRCTGEMLDLAPVVLYGRDGSRREFTDVESDWGAGFRRASSAFVDGLLDGSADVDMTAEDSARVLQLCFAVYQASNERRPVDPSAITTSVSPAGWPYARSADMPR
jgi:predicted dehydrogenase